MAGEGRGRGLLDRRRLSSLCRGGWSGEGTGALSGASDDRLVHVTRTVHVLAVALGTKKDLGQRAGDQSRHQIERRCGGLFSVTPRVVTVRAVTKMASRFLLTGNGTLNLQKKKTRVDNTTVIDSSRSFKFFYSCGDLF